MKCWRQRLMQLAAGLLLLVTDLSASYAALPSTIPFKPGSESDDNLIYRAIAAFLVAGAFAYAIAWCIKRYGPSMMKKAGRSLRDPQLERLESMRMSPRSTLTRVRWGNEELLLGENEHGVTLLGKRSLDTVAESVKDTHE